MNRYDFSELTTYPTAGLVPYRRRRGVESGDRHEAEEWARARPWFPRVRAIRFDARFWTWFCEPTTAEELASIEARP